jgi:hypothetical protein
MPFILGVLIAIGLSATLVAVMLENTFWRSADVCGFGSDVGHLRSGFLRVVVRKIGTFALLLVRMVRAPPQGALVKLKLSAVIGPM